MRTIAVSIKCPSSVICDYFVTEGALLLEVTRLGFLRLTDLLRENIVQQMEPLQLVEEMWLTYWRFAFREKEIYKLMFGIGTICDRALNDIPEVNMPARFFIAAIKALYDDNLPDEGEITSKYYAYWSTVHGLISLNLVNKGCPDEINLRILQNSVQIISNSISGQ